MLPHDAQLDQDVDNDSFGNQRYLRKAPRRRAFPRWSKPTEVWSIALSPNFTAKKTTQKTGIGRKKVPDPPAKFIQRMKDTLTQIRRTARTPMNWARAWSFSSSKNKGKAGVAGLRLMHCFDCVGMARYHRVANWAGEPWEKKVPHWAQGSIPHRRRETAILSMRSASWRLNQMGKSHIF